MEVTRQQFQAAIEHGIGRARVNDERAEKLREVGRSAERCTVGNFANCPLTQAGFGLDGECFYGRITFAMAFDRNFPGTFAIEVVD